MMPVVFRIPFINRDVPGYGLMLMIGFMVGIIWAARRAAKSRANPDVVLNCGFVALITGVVGARIMYVVHYWDQFKSRGDAAHVAWAVIDVTKGGMEFYGGFVLTVIAAILWLRWREKVSLRWYFDILAPSAAIGLAFGRLGCLLNGCCWGGVCDLPWAMRFPFGANATIRQWEEKLPGAGMRQELIFIRTDEEHGYSISAPITREVLTARPEDVAKKPQYGDIRAQMKKYGLTFEQLRALASQHHSLPVQPTQLYSFITAALIAFLLNAVYWRRTRDGQVIFTLLLIQPMARWLIEVIRADNPLDTMGFTISQFLAICMTVIGLVGLLALRRLPPRSRRAQPWEPPEEEPRTKAKGRSASAAS